MLLRARSVDKLPRHVLLKRARMKVCAARLRVDGGFVSQLGQIESMSMEELREFATSQSPTVPPTDTRSTNMRAPEETVAQSAPAEPAARGRDWNEDFQTLLEQISDEVRCRNILCLQQTVTTSCWQTILEQENIFAQLGQLARDFVFAASTLGKRDLLCAFEV